MLRIAICDDDVNDLELIGVITSKLLKSLNIDYEIEEFSSGIELLNSTISFNLLLLDIEMDDLNGIETARKIRMLDRFAKIVFITNSQDYLKEGYRVKAEGYFSKPINEIEFNYELTNILTDEIMDNKFIYDSRVGPYKLYLNEILYIEFANRKSIVHKITNNLESPLRLKEWLSILGKYNFCQCYKAYVVNFQHVKDHKINSIVLSSGEEIPLGRYYKSEFKEKYFTFISEKF